MDDLKTFLVQAVIDLVTQHGVALGGVYALVIAAAGLGALLGIVTAARSLVASIIAGLFGFVVTLLVLWYVLAMSLPSIKAPL